MRGLDYIRHWLVDSQYLSTIWDTIEHNWQLFWNSELLKQLTKPDILRLFGISAFLGIIVPLLTMIGWRMFSRRGVEKNNNYTQLDSGPPGGFNSKVISSISGGKRKQKIKKEFDSIAQTPEPIKLNKKHVKSNDSKESIPLLNSKDENKTRKKPLKNNQQKSSSQDSTRINKNFNPDDFKLDEHDIEEISHMELHGKLKSATLRAKVDKLEESMSAEEKEKEKRLKMEQLEKIFALMQNEGGSKFGIESKEELMDQLKFYGS